MVVVVGLLGTSDLSLPGCLRYRKPVMTLTGTGALSSLLLQKNVSQEIMLSGGAKASMSMLRSRDNGTDVKIYLYLFFSR